MKKDSFVPKTEKNKGHLDFNAKHLILLQCKYHVIELFLRKEHKNNPHEDKEHVRNLVHHMWILGIRNNYDQIRTSQLTAERAERKR